MTDSGPNELTMTAFVLTIVCIIVIGWIEAENAYEQLLPTMKRSALVLGAGVASLLAAMWGFILTWGTEGVIFFCAGTIFGLIGILFGTVSLKSARAIREE